MHYSGSGCSARGSCPYPSPAIRKTRIHVKPKCPDPHTQLCKGRDKKYSEKKNKGIQIKTTLNVHRVSTFYVLKNKNHKKHP